MQTTRALMEGGPQAGVSTAAQTSVSDSAAQVLAANPKRKGLIITNTGTTVIKLVLGTGTPTQTVYHIPLAACSAADDGNGGSYADDAWVGAVQAISSAAGGTMVIVEFTTGSPNWNLAMDRGTNELT